jgi:hypothetical protein
MVDTSCDGFKQFGFINRNKENTWNNVLVLKPMAYNFLCSPPIDLLMVSIGIAINVYFIVMVLRFVQEMPNQQRTLITWWTECKGSTNVNTIVEYITAMKNTVPHFIHFDCFKIRNTS